VRVVIPWAPGPREYHELVARVLRADGLEPEPVRLDDNLAYGRLLVELWEAHETFVVIEHDIIPWPWAVDSMLRCANHWCRYPYRQHGGYAAGFGCMKIEGSLADQYPRLVAEVAARDAHPWPAGDWRIIDVVIDMELRRRGVEPHEHLPGVAHLSARLKPYRRTTT